MITIHLPDSEFWDERNEEFVYYSGQTLELEHSLASVSKWESKWNKPFLDKLNEKTEEESLDYIRCMSLNGEIDDKVLSRLSKKNIDDVYNYINAPMTATTFSKMQESQSREIITAEIIYYWMVSLQIPFECQYWHFNKLLAFIKVCNIKNKPAKKMSKRSVMNQNAALNAARRRQLNSNG